MSSSVFASSFLMATEISESRICFAFVSMRFSPAESPLSSSWHDRFRTTSATW